MKFHEMIIRNKIGNSLGLIENIYNFVKNKNCRIAVISYKRLDGLGSHKRTQYKHYENRN